MRIKDKGERNRSPYHFFTPVYSSTVLEEIVVVVFVQSVACV